MHASGSQPIVNPIWAATEIDSHRLLAPPLPWIGASAAIPGVTAPDSSHLSNQGCPEFERE